MATEVTMYEIGLMYDYEEHSVCTGKPNTLLLSSRDFSEDTYRVPPLWGDEISVHRVDFESLVLEKFGQRLDPESGIALREVMSKPETQQLRQYFYALQPIDQATRPRYDPVLYCLINIEGIIPGMQPSISLYITSSIMVDYFDPKQKEVT